MARHHAFTLATDMDVYFCDPPSPWQRGTNENTNGLLRQYFPREDCLSDYTQAELDMFASKLNTRPRKTIGFRTPVETFWPSLIGRTHGKLSLVLFLMDTPKLVCHKFRICNIQVMLLSEAGYYTACMDWRLIEADSSNHV